MAFPLLSTPFLFVEKLFASAPSIFVVFGSSILFKTGLVIALIAHSIQKKKAVSYIEFLLSTIIISSVFEDNAWIAYALKCVANTESITLICSFITKIAWGFSAIHYQALSLFLEKLINKDLKLTIRHYICLTISCCFFLFFCVGACITIQESSATHIERLVRQFFILFSHFPLSLTSIILAYKATRSNHLPNLLKQQLHLVLFISVIPAWVFDLLQVFPFNLFHVSSPWITNSYAFANFASIFLTFSIYFCAKRVMGLRFLNIEKHVRAQKPSQLTARFQVVLEDLSHVVHVQELTHITHRFFKESFKISSELVSLTLLSEKKQLLDASNNAQPFRTKEYISSFLVRHAGRLFAYVRTTRLLIYDEISFSNFYESSESLALAVQFMEEINADIFIPILSKDALFGYIIVSRHARSQALYTDVEKDEMILFANYFSHIINLLNQQDLSTLVEQSHELKHELYQKHQEIGQYRECLKSFMRSNNIHSTGILFYKKRHFVFANQAAQEFIKINPNQLTGHVLARALKEIVHLVEQYKTTQTSTTQNLPGVPPLVLTAMPSLDKNTILITVHPPEITDMLKIHTRKFNNPSDWDYILYLETTQSGKLINTLVPGNSDRLMMFKISLLKIALCKDVIFLDLPDDDLSPTIDLLHHISLRERLHVIDLRSTASSSEYAIKLFGVNKLLGIPTTEQPLLSQLDGCGTLFIRNIHFLDIETQMMLADFIRYGQFRVCKGDEYIISDVRIICSSHRNLAVMTQEGTFSKQLFEMLKRTSIFMPSLAVLSSEEINELAQGYTCQTTQGDPLKNLLALTEKDRDRLIFSSPSSLQELKSRVCQIIAQKSKRNNIDNASHLKGMEHTDPALATISELGKKALKDSKVMTLLWEKFHNQKKIAAILGVNRSSVNRRCREYGLQ